MGELPSLFARSHLKLPLVRFWKQWSWQHLKLRKGGGWQGEMSFDQVLKTGFWDILLVSKTPQKYPRVENLWPFFYETHLKKNLSGGVICWWELAMFVRLKKPSGAWGDLPRRNWSIWSIWRHRWMKHFLRPRGNDNLCRLAVKWRPHGGGFAAFFLAILDCWWINHVNLAIALWCEKCGFLCNS